MRTVSFVLRLAGRGLGRLTPADVSTANALDSSRALAHARREREEVDALVTATLARRALPDLS